MALNKTITLASAQDITTTTSSATRSLGPTEGRDGYVGLVSVAAITGTNPTLDIKIQHSADNANWVDLLTFTQLVSGSANTTAHKFPTTATDHLIPLLSYVRATWTIGGTDTPTFNDVTIKLFI